MTAPPLTRRPTRVLLADDSEGLRLLVRSWLSSEDDLEVVAEATNGAEAVALADAHRPDVVVLDVAMPVMDGLEALTELQRRFPDLPVVMHSGFAEGQVARQAVARGARAFVEKSGDLGLLVEALRAAARVPAPRTALDAALPPPAPVPPALAREAVAMTPGPSPSASPGPAVLAVLALLVLAISGPALGEAGTPGLLVLVVPVVLLALRHGQRGGLLGAAGATAAAGGWALAVPGVGAAHVLACAAACGTVGLALGGTVAGRSRAEEQQRRVSGAVVASNRALAEANDRLVALNADLQASNDDLRQFGEIAGHDLLEPLRAIDGSARLLEQRCGPSLDLLGRQHLTGLADGVRRMRALVDDLHAYARAGQATLALEPVDLAEVVAGVTAAQRVRIAERGADVRVGPLPVVRGDRDLLGLVLQNLVANALTFTTSSAPVVEVAAERAGGLWEVRVSDDGIGVDPDLAEAVFGLFTRLHPGEDPGTGLGLAIVKRVVERHGGSVRLGPRAGGGTTVVVCLPALDAAA